MKQAEGAIRQTPVEATERHRQESYASGTPPPPACALTAAVVASLEVSAVAAVRAADCSAPSPTLARNSFDPALRQIGRRRAGLLTDDIVIIDDRGFIILLLVVKLRYLEGEFEVCLDSSMRRFSRAWAAFSLFG